MHEEILVKYRDFLKAHNRGDILLKRVKFCLSEFNRLGIDYKTLNQEQIVNWFNQSFYQAETKNSYIVALKSFYHFLGYEGTKNPFHKDNFARITPPVKRHIYITYEELLGAINNIVTYGVTSLSSQQVRGVLWFMFFSGARISEVLKIHRADFDVENGTAILRDCKNGEDRLVVYPKNLAIELKILFSWLAEEKNAFNVSKKQIYNLTRNISKYTGKHILPHGIRHSFGRNSLKSGLSLELVARLMGHKSTATTLRYTEWNDKDSVDIYHGKINPVLGGVK